MIEGFVEAYRQFQVRGWAKDLIVDKHRPEVRLLVDGKLLSVGRAELFRQDLIEAGHGDGQYAFVLNLDHELPLDRLEAIRVEAFDADGFCETLPTSDGITIEAPRSAISQSPPLKESTLKGFFAVHPSCITGWAYDSATPDRHVDVELIIDNLLIARATASSFRVDLAAAGVGAGDHSFSLTSEYHDDASHIEVVAISETGQRLYLPHTDSSQSNKPIASRLSGFFPSCYVDEQAAPVFVLGAARSGTSAMAQALVRSGAFRGSEEGHFLDLILTMRQTVQQFFVSRAEELARDTLIAQVPISFIDEGLRHILVEATRLTFPGMRWVDKTPRSTMISAAPILRQIWPKARFVVMRRRAIENLDSRLRKFGNQDFDLQCKDWTQAIAAWHSVEAELTGAAAQIDQLVLAREPRRVAASLGPFLEISQSETERLCEALIFDRPEQTSGRFDRPLSLQELDWSKANIESFQRICAPTMLRCGYTTDERYFISGDVASGLLVP